MQHARRTRSLPLILVAVLAVVVTACQIPGGTPPSSTTTTTTAPVARLSVSAPDALLTCGAVPSLPLSCAGPTSVTVTNTGTAPTAGGLSFASIPFTTRDAGCDAALAPGASCTTVFSVSQGFTAAPFRVTRTVTATDGTVSGSDPFDAIAQVAVLRVELGTPAGITIPRSVSGLLFDLPVGVGCTSVVGNDVCVWSFRNAVVRNVGNVATTAPITFTQSGFLNTPPSCTGALAPNATCSLVAPVPVPPPFSGSITAGPTVAVFEQTSPYSANVSLTAASAGAIGHTATATVSD